MKKPKVLVIVGPTASGKTSLSIKLAKQFAGEVISADSRQVYRKLDVGTEKVSAAEMEGVPHHLLDVVDVYQVYTAVDYARDGQAAIASIAERTHLPIVAGGTFFYIDALLGHTTMPKVPPNLAQRAELEDMSLEALQAKLQALDPSRAAVIDMKNPRRIMRALEIASALGSVPPLPSTQSPYDVLTIGIQTDRTALRARIRARAQQALGKGLIEETTSLLASGVSKERLGEIGLEYRIIMEYIDGTLTDEQLIQKLEEKNWQYAKRQLTWLKRDESVEWYPREDLDGISAHVGAWLA